MSHSMQPPGDKMKKVLSWVGEILAEHPKKKRTDVFREAQVRFDLSPLGMRVFRQSFYQRGQCKRTVIISIPRSAGIPESCACRTRSGTRV